MRTRWDGGTGACRSRLHLAGIRMLRLAASPCSPSPGSPPNSSHRRRPRAVPRATRHRVPRRARVLLHRVGRNVQGPIDSTDRRRHGAASVPVSAPTPARSICLSARYGGIEYFSRRCTPTPSGPIPAIASRGLRHLEHGADRRQARHLVVPRAGAGRRPGGARSDRAPERRSPCPRSARLHPPDLVARRCPRGTGGLELGESDLSPDAVTRRGDSVMVLAPFAPGEKQLTIAVR